MKIIKAKNYDEMSIKAAEIYHNELKTKPDSVLGLATGSTVLGLYAKLIEYNKAGELDFSAVTSFNLDEYVRITSDNDQSYRYYMNKNFFEHINIKQENTYLPDGMAADLDRECDRYNALIEKLGGGADIQLLGLGGNGHVGFNEPDDHFPKQTHVVDLNKETIQANARFFASIDDVPKKALTIGIQNIMWAKKIVLCVSGEQKAAALKQVMTGEITPKVPGSILQLHKDCIVVADEDACSAL